MNIQTVKLSNGKENVKTERKLSYEKDHHGRYFNGTHLKTIIFCKSQK